MVYKTKMAHLSDRVIASKPLVPLFSFYFFSQLYCLIWISPVGNSVCFPQGKPTETVTLPNIKCMLRVFVFP